MEALVSIITVNFNQSKVTCELLSSLRKISYRNIEIIVVDNNSQLDNPECIKAQYPEIIFIQSATNLGFAGGNNLGIEKSKGEFILLLNNDTEVDTSFLEPLVNYLQNHPETGIVGPKIRYYFQPNLIQFAGYTPLNQITMRNHLIGFKEEDKRQYDKIRETPFAHGAALLVRRKAIDIVGFMPEIYFLYYEELDWEIHIKKLGLNIVFIPKSLVFHKESISTGKNSALKTYYMARNRLIFARRNNSLIPLVISILYQILVAFPKNLISFAIQNRFDLLKAYCRGVWNGLLIQVIK